MSKLVGTWLTGAALAVAASLGAASSANAALTSNVMGAAGADLPASEFGPADFEPVVMTTLSGEIFDLHSMQLALGPRNLPGHDTVTMTGDFGDHTESVDYVVGYGFLTHTPDWHGLHSVSFSPLTAQTNEFGDLFWGYLVFDNIQYATAGGGAAVVDFEDQLAGSVRANDRDSGGMHFTFWMSVIYGPADSVDFPTTAGIPEPASWALMILGFAGVGAALRTRRKAALA